MQNVQREDNASRKSSANADEFRRTVRAILVVLERLAAHAGVEAAELDLLCDDFFNGPDAEQDPRQ